MSIEAARQIMTATKEPAIASLYVEVASEVQHAIDINLDPRYQTNTAFAISNRYYNAYGVATRNEPDNPAVRAAMLDGAISLRGYRYRNFNSPMPISTLEEVWKNTRFQGLAASCDQIVEALKPKLDGKYTHINISEMWADFNQVLTDGGPEHLVVTGLNGVGKSTQIEALMAFLKMANIKSQLIKMPQERGPLGSLLQNVLQGKEKLNPRSIQHTMLADAFNVKTEADTFVVYDRHPSRDALVYGPANMIMSILASNEMFDGNVWTIVLDRHFNMTHSEVEKRKVAPRIFEKKIDGMIEQFIRFSGLTFLPGVIWLNGDTASTKDKNWPIEYTMRKFFGGIFTTGVLQRHMIKNKLVGAQEEANQFLSMAFNEFLRRWQTTPDWIKKTG